MELEKTLKNYGLTEKQAIIYVTCLELGSASVQKISQKSGIARSTSYEILEFLNKMGFVSTFKKKQTSYFSAEDPQKIISLAQEKADSLKKALPQFKAIYGEAKARPTVRFFQGKSGMKLILEEILQEAKDIITFSSAEDLFNTLGDYFPEFVKKRIKLKISTRVILKDSEKARERQRKGPQELRQVKILPKDYDYQGMIMIWQNKTAMFSFKKDLTALVIDSEEITKVQKAMMDNIWDNLE